MLRPNIFLSVVVVLVILGIAGWYYSSRPSFKKTQQNITESLKGANLPPKNITLLFIDITKSDTGKAWTNNSFRLQFVNAVNKCLTGSQDIIAAYLIHGKTIDEQPFWTNAPLSAMQENILVDSASMVAGIHLRQHCIEAFDSVAADKFLSRGNPIDSMLMESTDIFGALQQSALYFRQFANNSLDTKRIFMLSDAKENAGTFDGNIKLNTLGSLDTARLLAAKALKQVQRTTDIKDELAGTDVYILSPNNELYANDERNTRRVFWQVLLVDQLHCNKLYYF